MYAGLNFGHQLGGLLQLPFLGVREGLADDVAHAAVAQHARQRQKHLLFDAVFALKPK